MEVSLIITEDGSHTLFNAKLGDIYHSKFGAISESEHIFINAGLVRLTSTHKSICILEVGFGTGLNALLTCLRAQNNKTQISYHAIEPFPLSEKIYSKLNYAGLITETGVHHILMELHGSEENRETAITQYFSLLKLNTTIGDFQPDDLVYDLVYFDAFSPDVQPQLWTTPTFKKIFKAMKPGGILVTYSSRGMVKKCLTEAGFQIEKLPGPKGKREFIRAIKPGQFM